MIVDHAISKIFLDEIEKLVASASLSIDLTSIKTKILSRLSNDERKIIETISQKSMNLLAYPHKCTQLSPIRSIFTTLEHNINRGKSSKSYFDYDILTNQPIYTQNSSNISRAKLNQWKQAFEQDLKKIDDLTPNIALVLLEKYTSFIGIDQETSFYDLIKTHVAISSCLLHESLNSNTPYLLIGGDISGVQRFIYTITSKSALKTLRARSFYLELLTEHIIFSILQELELTRANLVFSGGAKFYLIAPHTPEVKDKLHRWRSEFNRWIYREHQGNLFLAMNWLDFGSAYLQRDEEEKNFSVLWSKIGDLLNEEKKSAFAEFLLGEFEPVEEGTESCCICKQSGLSFVEFDEEGDESVCPLCYKFIKWGERINQAKYILITDSIPVDTECYLRLQDTIYLLKESLDSTMVFSQGWVINNFEFDAYLQSNFSLTPLYLGNYFAQNDNKSFDFDDFAKSAIGADRIGTLRMDVDHLGSIFSSKLPAKYRNLIGMATLSRLMTYFFKIFINSICKGDLGEDLSPLTFGKESRERKISIVYAGGDDLFIIGSWNDVVEVAFDINQSFQRYTDQRVTISGGAIVTEPIFPLYKMAELAGKAENRAKDNQRDSLTLFQIPISASKDNPRKRQTTYHWSELAIIMEEFLKPMFIQMSLFDKQENRFKLLISRSFLRQLFIMYDLWLRQGIWYLPKIYYLVGRTEKELSKRHVEEGVLAGFQRIKNVLFNEDFISKLLVPLTWVELLIRGGVEDDD